MTWAMHSEYFWWLQNQAQTLFSYSLLLLDVPTSYLQSAVAVFPRYWKILRFPFFSRTAEGCLYIICSWLHCLPASLQHCQQHRMTSSGLIVLQSSSETLKCFARKMEDIYILNTRGECGGIKNTLQKSSWSSDLRTRR